MSRISRIEPMYEPASLRRWVISRVGMSVSSLHHHFKASTGLAPLQYQKQLRLNEAKRLLLTEHLDVAGAGERAGYHSASHFSRDYARFHGQPPRRDVSGRD